MESTEPSSGAQPVEGPPAPSALLRRALVVSYHVALWISAFLVAMVLRFEGSVSEPWATRQWSVAALLVTLRLLAFYRLGLFHGLWRYAGMPELKNITIATTIPMVICFIAGTFFEDLRMPRSTYVGEWLASIVLVGGSRFAIRLVREWTTEATRPNSVNTLIIGAGDTGESLLRDVQRNPTCPWVVRGFLDDNRSKANAIIRGVRVLGDADEVTLGRTIRELDIGLVVLAIPAAEGRRLRQIVDVCRRFKVATKTMPSLADRMAGEVSLAALREIAIEDLLRREPVRLDNDQVAGFLEDQIVLVTGAGGSIGSELCRQVLRFKPRTLLLFEHSENALFHIDRELRALGTSTELKPLVGDITDVARVEQVFLAHRPDVVFHAAAHKHVPMMECNPAEAVKNNVFGTAVVADAAARHKSHAFVMVSTDKAVNPTSIMGTTKRIAEMIVQARAARSSTRFVAVRFGNVLGSAGSVVPLFQEQIAKGGPVCVTHPEMRRYFMTIPEATQLILQAGALGKGGEVFLLDMGEPVKIVDLARDLIELSGLRPDVDIEIAFTGVRPGEKLFEELLHDHEAYDRTPHPKIVVGRFAPATPEALDRDLVTLRAMITSGDEPSVRTALARMVPEATLSLTRENRVSQEPAEERESRPLVASAQLS